jgi:hypothetical protein
MGKLRFLIFFSVLIFTLAGPSYGWQGRMTGMADPYGLLLDESDFLIHPSKIAQGKGITFYGDYRFTYTNVRNWDNHLDLLDTSGILTDFFHYDTSGNEYKHNALLGAAFPLGPGRIGAFFSFEKNRGDDDGIRRPFPDKYYMDSYLDDLSFSIIYGYPVNKLDFGLQLGAAHREEQKRWRIPFTQNNIWPTDYDQNLHFFMNPYDSNYWEMFWKAGLGTKFNSASFDWTVRGGYIIDSDNKYEYIYGMIENVDMRGNVEGWRIGSDAWLRYGLRDGLTLPILLSADHTKKIREGHGIGAGIFDFGNHYTYKHYEKTSEIKIGGGVEKKMNTNGLIGAGLYYHYLRGREHQKFSNPDYLGSGYFYDYIYFPLHKEHRLETKVAGEFEISPSVTLQMGLSSFYGWVGTHTFKQTSSVYMLTDEINLDGHAWGINASLGSTVKILPFSLEPFINGGYHRFKFDGDGDERSSAGTLIGRWNVEQNRDEWLIGGGFSIKFRNLKSD